MCVRVCVKNLFAKTDNSKNHENSIYYVIIFFIVLVSCTFFNLIIK